MYIILIKVGPAVSNCPSPQNEVITVNNRGVP